MHSSMLAIIQICLKKKNNIQLATLESLFSTRHQRGVYPFPAWISLIYSQKISYLTAPGGLILVQTEVLLSQVFLGIET